jgi:ribosomal protein L20A (L18A)
VARPEIASATEVVVHEKMGIYSEQVSRTKLFQQFDALIGYQEATQADVVELKSLVLKVADAIGPHLDRIRDTFWQYTEHDLRHLCNVADLVFRFLPKKSRSHRVAGRFHGRIKLNAVELACLWLAILLHDIGMYVSEGEKQQTLDSDPYREYLWLHPDRVTAAKKARNSGQEFRARAIEDALLAEYFRRLHPERVREYVYSTLASRVHLEFREVSLAEEVANLCESHSWGVRESNDPRSIDKSVSRMERNQRVSVFRINLQYLACCLRLGDILDFDKTRTPISVYEQIDFTEKESIKEWNKHLSVDGWQVEENRVQFRATCTQPSYYVAVHDFLNWVDDELRECRYLLDEMPAGDEENYALYLAHVVDRRQICMENKRYLAGGFKFRLEYDEIMGLLMDKSLYPDPALFLRELLQNSLDACRYQEALAQEAGMGDKYIPRIRVWDYSDDEKAPRIVFQDNGIGMSQRQVEDYFLRVGKSYYRSPGFDAEKQRLAEQGIHLDACSQFGMGFLSCFLAGDLIEIETYRFGSEPLKIAITGPSKYFLIEKLPRPGGTAVRFRSPDDALEDSPPYFPGTKITLYLRDGWRGGPEGKGEGNGEVQETLGAFAVNQDYEISICVDGVIDSARIGPRNWESARPLFCGFSLLFDDLDYLEELVRPSVFNLNSYCPELRGVGAIWLLNSELGPSPSKGDLVFFGRKHLSVHVGSPDLVFLASLSSARSGSGPVSQWQLEALMSGDEKLMLGALPRSEGFLNSRVLDAARRLSADDKNWIVERREQVLRLLGSVWVPGRSSPLGWAAHKEIAGALLKGDRDLLMESLSEVGMSALSGQLDLESRYLLSLFGINTPAGVLTWDPSSGTAQHGVLFPASVGIRIDAYGQLAPQPSASRLFVPRERVGRLQTAVGCAILHHATSLRREHEGVVDWSNWYYSFLQSCGTVVADAMIEEIVNISDILEVQCVLEGKPVRLTLRETVERFGESVPKVWGNSSQPNGVVVDVIELGKEGWMLETVHPTEIVRHLDRAGPRNTDRIDLAAILCGRRSSAGAS